jgi:hypothetical protein
MVIVYIAYVYPRCASDKLLVGLAQALIWFITLIKTVEKTMAVNNRTSGVCAVYVCVAVSAPLSLSCCFIRQQYLFGPLLLTLWERERPAQERWEHGRLHQTRKSERERERTGFALVTKGQAQGGSSLAGGQVDFKVWNLTLRDDNWNIKLCEIYHINFLNKKDLSFSFSRSILTKIIDTIFSLYKFRINKWDANNGILNSDTQH